MAIVLIVDDDAEIRATVRMALEDDGHSVLETPSGEDALMQLRSSMYPIVALVDLLLPLLSGEEVLKLVAAEHDLATRHGYILLTATHQSFQPGFEAVLNQLQVPVIHKPFDLDVLLGSIAQTAQRIGA